MGRLRQRESAVQRGEAHSREAGHRPLLPTAGAIPGWPQGVGWGGVGGLSTTGKIGGLYTCMLWQKTGHCCSGATAPQRPGPSGGSPGARRKKAGAPTPVQAGVVGGAAQYASSTTLSKVVCCSQNAAGELRGRRLPTTPRRRAGGGHGQPANSGACGVSRSRTRPNSISWAQAGLPQDPASPQVAQIRGTHLIPCEHCSAGSQGRAPSCR